LSSDYGCRFCPVLVDNYFYGDVEVGAEVPALVKHPTTMQLVKWAGASGDYLQIHYDKDFAQSQGLPGVIVHGWLAGAYPAGQRRRSERH